MSAVEGDVNSEFSTVLTVSLEEFFHKALKVEQKECIRRIVSLKEDVLAILLTGFGKSVIKLLNSDWLTLKAWHCMTHDKIA